MTSESHADDWSEQITEIDRTSVQVAGVTLMFETSLLNEPTNVQVLRRMEGDVEHVAMSAEVHDASGQVRQRRWETRMSGEMRFLDELT